MCATAKNNVACQKHCISFRKLDWNGASIAQSVLVRRGNPLDYIVSADKLFTSGVSMSSLTGSFV